MYFVTGERREVPISVTDLSSFLTCPLFFLRSKLQKKRVSRAIKNGLELHRRHYQLHAASAVELTLGEAIKLSEEGKLVGVEIWVDDGVVGGFIDRVELEDGSARVIELKSTERSALWRKSHLQAIIYGTLLLPLVDAVTVEVRTFDGESFFRKRLRGDESENLRRAEELFFHHVSRGHLPPNPGPHCRLCPFRKECPIFKESPETYLGVIEVAGDGRVQL